MIKFPETQDIRDAKPYVPEGQEKPLREFLKERVQVMKEARKNLVGNVNFDDVIKQADTEYAPKELNEKRPKGNSSQYLTPNDVDGYRGAQRVVPLAQEGGEWRSNVSEPTLLVKVQTALSILADQNPEAVFTAIRDNYKATQSMAKAIWKRSWKLAKSKSALGVFIFNLAMYGWAPWRTYPRIVKRPKDVLTELDPENPENNVYVTREVVEFNDIYREPLDPHRTWMDDKANMIDPISSHDDWYFEKDYSFEDFEREFGKFKNAKYVPFGQLTQPEGQAEAIEDPSDATTRRKDMVTLGFYQSKNKDLFAIWAPIGEIPLYFAPLPNDDGMLDVSDAVWNIRDPRTRYGIGLAELMRNNKLMYDRLDNMDLDQLVLAIYSMLFYSGASAGEDGDGQVVIVPGKMVKKLPGTSVEQIQFNYDGKGREGAQQQLDRIDQVTGLTPTLEGIVEGKTLGEVLHAKDAALKRLSTPLGNIAAMLERDAELTLSWAPQIYSIPEVREFATREELDEFTREMGVEPSKVTAPEEGVASPFVAEFPRALELELDIEEPGEESEEGDEARLVESPDERVFVVGTEEFPKSLLRWKGRITIDPQSVIAPSAELEKQRKEGIFNVVFPAVQSIAQAGAAGQTAVVDTLTRPIVAFLESQGEDPKNWLPKYALDALEGIAIPGAAPADSPLMVPGEGGDPAGSPKMAPGGDVPPGTEPSPTSPGSRAAEADVLVPKDTIPNPVADSMAATVGRG